MIQDLSGSWCIKGTGESMTRVDSKGHPIRSFGRMSCTIMYCRFNKINISSATQFDPRDVTCSKTQLLSFRCYSCESSFQVTVGCVSWWQAIFLILQSSYPLSFALSMENGEWNVHAANALFNLFT